MNSVDQIREDQMRAGRRMGGTIKKKKPTLVGHESFLKALEASGAVIEITKTSGDVLKGVVKHSDKFTISLDEGNGKPPRVLFKHAIEEFQPLEHADKKSTDQQ